MCCSVNCSHQHAIGCYCANYSPHASPPHGSGCGCGCHGGGISSNHYLDQTPHLSQNPHSQNSHEIIESCRTHTRSPHALISLVNGGDDDERKSPSIEQNQKI